MWPQLCCVVFGQLLLLSDLQMQSPLNADLRVTHTSKPPWTTLRIRRALSSKYHRCLGSCFISAIGWTFPYEECGMSHLSLQAIIMSPEPCT